MILLHNLEGSIGDESGSITDKGKIAAIKRILIGSVKTYMSQREEDYVRRDEDYDEMPYAKYMNILKKHLTRRAF